MESEAEIERELDEIDRDFEKLIKQREAARRLMADAAMAMRGMARNLTIIASDLEKLANRDPASE